MRRAVSIAGGLALATALSQFPEYAQQYTQRLGGAVDELRVIVEDFDRAATEGGFDRNEALARYGASTDTFLAGRGESMGRTFVRYERLSAALDEIDNADALERLRNLPLYLDTDIGARTLEAYKPAVPVTPEGFLYAFSGLVLGYLVTSGLFRLVTLPFSRRRGRAVHR
ncbi:DUF2937 family protein [Devosia nitrariae]|uniref:DUF2937 family protein n=1 Tax=Devosia nitrariae TaxID=2071872 RepID=A0ABQ5W8T1_9HYPH|nr:DUF2937 family protein [Devosia nitrariae]GLQ56041.1 hypothetical protein GCM10010862_33000 [Devosia nitrariae]